ncbi:MAG: hypothetical protein CL779_02825 [Chloroflexi bacterium]|nr:hypothetical protein [Chloroflexota bacterium]
MDLLHLVDKLEELVADSKKVPLGNRIMLPYDRILEIIDELRIAIPNDVREAEELVLNKSSLLRSAEEEAKLVISAAESKASTLMDEHEIVQSARLKADQIIQQGENNLKERINQANQEITKRIEDSRVLAQQEMGAADNYAKQLLERQDRQLQAFTSSVHNGLEQLDRVQNVEQIVNEDTLDTNNIDLGDSQSMELEEEIVIDTTSESENNLELSNENLEQIIDSNNTTEKIVDDFSLDDFDERK